MDTRQRPLYDQISEMTKAAWIVGGRMKHLYLHPDKMRELKAELDPGDARFESWVKETLPTAFGGLTIHVDPSLPPDMVHVTE